MRDDLYIGESPAAEPCAPVCRGGYDEQSRRVCRAFINQLRRTLGPEPPGARLFIKRNEHDFGTYLTVNCAFDTENEASVEYAYRLECEMPERWDKEARQDLGLAPAAPDASAGEGVDNA